MNFKDQMKQFLDRAINIKKSTALLTAFMALLLVSCSDPATDPPINLEVTLVALVEGNDVKLTGEYRPISGPLVDVKTRLEYKESGSGEWISCESEPYSDDEAVLVHLPHNKTYIARALCSANGKVFQSPEVEFTTNSHRYVFGDAYPCTGTPTGVVFGFSTTSNVGYIISLDEGSAVWSTEKIQTKADKSDGAENMAIIKALNPTLVKYPAFKWCADRGEGWYLPSSYQIMMDFNNAILLNQKIEAHGGVKLTVNNEIYWSSRELNSGYAWYANLDFGNFSTPDKSAKKPVRAIKEFPIDWR